MVQFQQTVGSTFSFEGIGLHTGEKCKVAILPAPSGAGIKFRRIDLDGADVIPALASSVTFTERGTILGERPNSLSTVEHLMATLYALGVDNALIEVDGPELPILDGSAAEYASIISSKPLVTQDLERDYFVIEEPIHLTEGESKISIYPDSELSFEVMIDFNSSTLGNQFAKYDKESNFIKDIAPSRTFVFIEDIIPLLQSNLIKGGAVENAIIISDNDVNPELLEQLSTLFGGFDSREVTRGYLNIDKLHYPNECARHKLLDLIGDLALSGVRFRGRVVAYKPGHKINTKFAKILMNMAQENLERPAIPTYDPNAEPVIDINGIKELLPHRPPFLMVDRITHLGKEEVVGIKTIGINEGFFIGHFPEEPVMPGVLIIEAMAQVGGILVLSDLDDPKLYSTYFLKIDNAKFRRKVVPGDVLVIKLKLDGPIRRSIVTMKGEVYVGDTLACEADLMAQVIKNR